MTRFALLSFSFFLLLSCSSSSEGDTETESPTDDTNTNPNIVLIIADDMGLDASLGYNLGSIKPNMPNLQNMINTGVVFNNVWSDPTCTPTRSGIITGKYGFRTGVTKVGDQLSTNEISLQKYLDDNTGSAYNQAVIGKWHLSTTAAHPNNMGIEYFGGVLRGSVPSYLDWDLTINGVNEATTDYTTSKLTDLAIDWIKDQSKPYFLWLAYNAPHSPLHLPSNNLHSQGSLPTDQASINANPLPYYMAMLEAMDTEFGRLLDAMGQEEKDNTIFIFVGDNGTPRNVIQEYNGFNAKGTLYQGGINVPMVISGKNVTRTNTSEDALINTTDLFATIADIAGTGTTEINDSMSFKSLLTTSGESVRDYTYAEIGNDLGGSDYTIRNTTYKYILYNDGTEELYNLIEDPLEELNLLSDDQLPLSGTEVSAKEELETALIAIGK